MTMEQLKVLQGLTEDLECSLASCAKLSPVHPLRFLVNSLRNQQEQVQYRRVRSEVGGEETPKRRSFETSSDVKTEFTSAIESGETTDSQAIFTQAALFFAEKFNIDVGVMLPMKAELQLSAEASKGIVVVGDTGDAAKTKKRVLLPQQGVLWQLLKSSDEEDEETTPPSTIYIEQVASNESVELLASSAGVGALLAEKLQWSSILNNAALEAKKLPKDLQQELDELIEAKASKASPEEIALEAEPEEQSEKANEEEEADEEEADEEEEVAESEEAEEEEEIELPTENRVVLLVFDTLRKKPGDVVRHFTSRDRRLARALCEILVAKVATLERREFLLQRMRAQTAEGIPEISKEESEEAVSSELAEDSDEARNFEVCRRVLSQLLPTVCEGMKAPVLRSFAQAKALALLAKLLGVDTSDSVIGDFVVWRNLSKLADSISDRFAQVTLDSVAAPMHESVSVVTDLSDDDFEEDVEAKTIVGFVRAAHALCLKKVEDARKAAEEEEEARKAAEQEEAETPEEDS